MAGSHLKIKGGWKGDNSMRIEPFGITKDGKQVTAYILQNKNGMEVHILDFGATIAKLYVPDRNGTLDDLVLGFDDMAGYERNAVASHGAVVGRVANRIGNGLFELNGVTYELEKNNAGNCLHGGASTRYEYQLYDAVPNEEKNSVVLKRVSPHMEQGFPGNLTYSVEYHLTEDNELHIIYDAVTDQDTPINITNHSYFNLKGQETQDLSDHLILIRSSKITETDENLLPNGNYIDLAGTPMDLSTLTEFLSREKKEFAPLVYGVGFDHNYVLDHKKGQPDAVVIELTKGRKMEMYTDLPGVQFYTGNWLDGEIGKGGKAHKQYGGFCLETQYYPNSCNIPEFPNAILKAGQKYHSVTTYKFATIE